MDEITKNVVDRFQDKTAMSVEIRDAPPTYDWGWYSREDPRMHVQTVDQKHQKLHYKVWLEERGARIFKPDGSIPAPILKELLKAVRKEGGQVELDWTYFMLNNDWLSLYLEPDQRHIVVTAYPNTSGKFQRRVDALDHFPGIGPLKKEDIALCKEEGTIKFKGRLDIDLSSILWVGKR